MRPHLVLFLLLTAVGVGIPYLAETGQSAPEPAAAEPRSEANPYAPRTVDLRADGLGHFTVEASINGRRVAMLADTGASAVVLTEDDARRAGFNPGSLDYSAVASTANGTTSIAAVTLHSVEVDGIVLEDVSAFVARPDTLHRSLLGMTFIGRLGRFSLEGDRLVLSE